MEDIALLHAWRAGDRAAGNQLFQRYLSSVYRFFRNKVDHGVEDLVQRTFMACVEGRDRLRADASFRSYLFGTAHNLLRVHYRKRKILRRVEPADELSIVDMGASPSSVVTLHHEQRILLEALRRIPLKQQVLLELYYWNDLTGRELGEVFAVPENTARTQVRRARLRLKLEIEKIEAKQGRLKSTYDNLDRWAARLREKVGGPSAEMAGQPKGGS